LQSYENPAYGGWGARFGVASNTVWKKNETVYNKNQGLVISITRKLAKGEVTDNITLNGSDTCVCQYKSLAFGLEKLCTCQH